MTGETWPARREGDPGAMARSELRASHEDRDRVVEILRVAAGDGRLTAGELDERLEAALTARTMGELAVLTTDLPVAGQAAAATAAPEPKDVVRIQCTSGSAQRHGSWVVPRRLEVRVNSGSVRLDFTEALITSPVLHIDAEVQSGSLRLVTRPGIVVDTDDVSVRSGTAKVRAPGGAGPPTRLRIEVSGRVGSGSIVARPPRRSLWDWLLRRPPRYAVTGG
jgi:Domain of unknown function (DUF1707)